MSNSFKRRGFKESVLWLRAEESGLPEKYGVLVTVDTIPLKQFFPWLPPEYFLCVFSTTKITDN